MITRRRLLKHPILDFDGHARLHGLLEAADATFIFIIEALLVQIVSSNRYTLANELTVEVLRGKFAPSLELRLVARTVLGGAYLSLSVDICLDSARQHALVFDLLNFKRRPLIINFALSVDRHASINSLGYFNLKILMI